MPKQKSQKKVQPVEDDVVSELKDFQRVRENHSRPLYQFNSAYNGEIRSLTTYIEYCFRKLNQFVDIPKDSEDYEIHLALPNIRNKLFAILYRVAAQRMKSEFYPQNVEQPFDKIVQKFLSELAEWSDETSQQLMVTTMWLFETCFKGTGILCEDYYKHTREIPEVQVYDTETGKSTWKKKKIVEDKCYSFVIPLEEFYVWDISLPFYRIQEQYKIYWETVMKWEDFQAKFHKYPNAKNVKKSGDYRTENEPFYNDNLRDLEDDQVRVIRVWCREMGTFKIIAGGEKLTEDDIFPFKHGFYPVIPLIYELIQFDFFYGKSFVDKNGNLSDAIDQLFNDTFNLNQLEMKAPLVAKQGSTLQDSPWRPNNILWYTGEKPEPLSVSRTGSQNTDRLFGILKNQMDLSSVSETFQGQTGSGSTAREIILAQENTLAVMNGLIMVLEWGEWMRMQMRMSNMLQFQTTPLLLRNLTENADEFMGAYREVVRYDVELENGRRGTRKIKIMPKSKMSSFSQLERQQSDTLEIWEIDAEFIRNLKLYIKVIPNSSIKQSKTLQKALDLEFTSTSMTLFPDLANKQELYTNLIETFDKSPEKLILKQEVGGMDEQIEKMLAGGGQNVPQPTAQRMQQPEKVLSNMMV